MTSAPRVIGQWEINMAANGVPYYFNLETQESVWTMPPELAATLAADSTPKSKRWEECRGPNDTPYYFDIHTQVSLTIKKFFFFFFFSQTFALA